MVRGREGEAEIAAAVVGRGVGLWNTKAAVKNTATKSDDYIGRENRERKVEELA